MVPLIALNEYVQGYTLLTSEASRKIVLNSRFAHLFQVYWLLQIKSTMYQCQSSTLLHVGLGASSHPFVSCEN